MKAVLQSYIPGFKLVIDRGSKRPPVNLSAIGLLFIIAIFIALPALAGFLVGLAQPAQKTVAQPTQTNSPATQPPLQLKLDQRDAELALRDSQLKSLQLQIEQDLRKEQVMRQRLAMFDDVLAARDVRGVHVLHPDMHWSEQDGVISYQLVLVKGENYPRWALGHVEFSARLPDGNSILLRDKKGRSEHKYEMTTHLFMEGTLLWPEKSAPTTLHVTLIDHRGKKIRQTDIPVFTMNSTEISQSAAATEHTP